MVAPQAVKADSPSAARANPFFNRSISQTLGSWTNSVWRVKRSDSETLKKSDPDDRTDSPPSKRRRLSLVALSPEIHDVEDCLAYPTTSHSNLRVEILKTLPKGASPASFTVPESILRANCRITVSDGRYDRPKVLFCRSQIGNVVVMRDKLGRHRSLRVHLAQPLEIPRDCLLVNRIHEDTFDFAESYHVAIELESAGTPQWPPLSTEELGIKARLPLSSARHWILMTEFVTALFGDHQAPLSLRLGHGSTQADRATNQRIEVDFRWSTGFLSPSTPSRLPNLDAKAEDIKMKSLLDDFVDKSTMEAMIKHLEHTPHRNPSQEEEDESDAATPLTPSRSLRVRGSEKNYNLLSLSNNALGWKKKGRKARPVLADAPSGQIKYYLPPCEPVFLAGYSCVSCGLGHRSLNELQLHLESAHHHHLYKLENEGQEPGFRVTSAVPSATSLRDRTLEVKPPKRAFDLTAYLKGDTSWIGSRTEPDASNGTLPSQNGTKRKRGRPPTLPDDKPVKKRSASTAQANETPKKSVIIPQSKRIYYDPVSKVQLKPGQKLPTLAAEEDWFNYKQRESLNDIEDVTDAEVEYMKEFDSVMRMHDVHARRYLPRAWVDFVRLKAAWLVEAQYRMGEFAQHEAYLVASDLIQDEHMEEAVGYINAARAKLTDTNHASLKKEPTTDDKMKNFGPPSREPANPRSDSGCGVCGLPVISGPRLLVCSNTVSTFSFRPRRNTQLILLPVIQACLQQLHHVDCVGIDLLASAPSDWLCEKCVEASQDTS
jgi:hypothetical protein